MLFKWKNYWKTSWISERDSEQALNSPGSWTCHHYCRIFWCEVNVDKHFLVTYKKIKITKREIKTRRRRKESSFSLPQLATHITVQNFSKFSLPTEFIYLALLTLFYLTLPARPTAEGYENPGLSSLSWWRRNLHTKIQHQLIILLTPWRPYTCL